MGGEGERETEIENKSECEGNKNWGGGRERKIEWRERKSVRKSVCVREKWYIWEKERKTDGGEKEGV